MIRSSSFIIAFLVFVTSCNNSNIEQYAITSKKVDSTKMMVNNDSLLQSDVEFEIHKSDSHFTIIETIDQTQEKEKDERKNPTRYIEFPGDAHFNGKPMTQQENISNEILEEHPDTLSKLAIARYKTYDHFFPKSIADNFEDGISTEHIHYPEKLFFRFELFENESSRKPYIIRDIIVRHNPNGELYTEYSVE